MTPPESTMARGPLLGWNALPSQAGAIPRRIHEGAGIEDDRKEPLFRSAIGKTGRLTDRPMTGVDAWRMVRRRAADAGIETPICNHTFRATGVTDYLTNGGRIEVAQRMAGHSNAKTTGLYDRRNDDMSVGEVERIGI
jgi:integrase/recombinase XerD